MELDTVYAGVTIRDRLDQGVVSAERIRQIVEHLGLPDLGTPPDVNAGKVVFTLVETEAPDGFVIEVWADGIEHIGAFSSVQLDFDFPPGVNFISADPGSVIRKKGWTTFALGTDGHAKEGLFGAFASSKKAVTVSSGSVLISRGKFTGPFVAAYLVDIKRVKMSYGATRFPIAKTERVTPGD